MWFTKKVEIGLTEEDALKEGVKVGVFIYRPRGDEYRIEEVDGNPTLFIKAAGRWQLAEIYDSGLDDWGRLSPGRFEPILWLGSRMQKERHASGVAEKLAELNGARNVY
jgi:hypothetical protein